jgi:uncharacterized protein (TIGR00251 family)
MIRNQEETFRDTPAGVLMQVAALPRSSSSGVIGVHNGVVKIKLAAPPLAGRANEECVTIIAKALRMSKGDVEIVAGSKGRAKTVLLRGVSSQMLARFFGADGKLTANGK